MEGKNKFNTYVVSFDYPSSYSSVFLRLRSLMYDMNFSSIVADEYGIPRQLNENSFAITTSLAASEIEDLIRLKCLDLPDIDFDLNIMTVDDYFCQIVKLEIDATVRRVVLRGIRDIDSTRSDPANGSS